jgi:hypothetical protein
VQEDLPLSAGSAPLRAPAADGAVVAVPPLNVAGDLLADNARRLDAFSRSGAEVLGVPGAELRRQAARAAADAARDYLARSGEPLPTRGPGGLLLAGHQPELFHPGVWVKNFALAGLARAHGRTALNLVVDNDTLKSVALRVPAPADTAHLATLRTIPFDHWAGEIPYEERHIADPAFFASFPDRVLEVLQGWGYESLLPGFWAEVLRVAGRTPLVGQCIAAARRCVERAWGCHNLELPVSVLCHTAPFRRFACHLLAELPRFHPIYNAALHDYRTRNHVRGRNHPVPDLAAEGDWLESPLWGWRSGQPRRGRLFSRATPRGVELRAGNEPWPTLPPPRGHPDEAVAALGELESRGFKVRTRALTTTLFARVFLADLFVHGIGGGKYDELTDEIVRRFWGALPPGFLVLSATLWLPPARAERDDAAALLRRESLELRDLHWNPQRHLGDGQADRALRELARKKADWAAREPATAPERRRRFEVLRELTDALRRPLLPRERRLADGLEALRLRAAGQEVLRRRDYAFVLYPESSLRPFGTQFLAPPAGE